MMEKLVLVVGDCVYRFFADNTWTTYHRDSWELPYSSVSRGKGSPQELAVGGYMWLRTHKSSRVLRWVNYDPNSGMTMEEALYNAEWIQGYEYRVSTQGKILSINAKNPYAKGTPEQKWWEAGYWAALKENKRMADPFDMLKKPVVELPDAKVEILLKLNEKQTATRQQLEKTFCSYGKACWAADDRDKKEHATQIAALQNALNALSIAVIGVRDLA